MNYCKQQEFIIKMLMLGMLNAYKKGFIGFDQMHFSLFAPKGEALMRKKHFEDVADFIETGMEFEDIQRFFGHDYLCQQSSRLELDILKSIKNDDINPQLVFEIIERIVLLMEKS